MTSQEDAFYSITEDIEGQEGDWHSQVVEVYNRNPYVFFYNSYKCNLNISRMIPGLADEDNHT